MCARWLVYACLIAGALQAQDRTHPSTPPSKGTPAAQYSPLAAQGGYDKGRVSPLEGVVRALNPKHTDYGKIWEQRRRVWLDNAALNPYFWYSFGVTATLMVSWFALAWMYNDRLRERWRLAEYVADALRYAQYCRRKGEQAIGRHNAHIEKCNRVIEAGDSGMVTPEAASLDDYRREIARLAAENDTKDAKLQRLQEELDRRNAEYTVISKRIDQAEQRVAARNLQEDKSGKLVERVNRLESENRSLTDELKRLRQQSKSDKAVETT